MALNFYTVQFDDDQQCVFCADDASDGMVVRDESSSGDFCGDFFTLCDRCAGAIADTVEARRRRQAAHIVPLHSRNRSR